MKNKLLKEYRTWFNLFKSQITKSADNQKKDEYMEIRRVLLAEDVERRRQQLMGMLLLLNASGVLQKDEYEKLCNEAAEEFDTKKLFNFGAYTRTEVYEC